MQRLLLLSFALSALGSEEEASGEDATTTTDDDLSPEEIVLYSVLGLVGLFGVVIIGRWCMARDVVEVPTDEPTNRYFMGRVWRATKGWTTVNGRRVY